MKRQRSEPQSFRASEKMLTSDLRSSDLRPFTDHGHGHDPRPRTPVLRSSATAEGGRITSTNHGFTLLEVMVSLAILATAFAAALRLHSDSMDMLISSRIHTHGSELAQFKMTDIELVGLKRMGPSEGDFGDRAPDYVWSIEVEGTPDPFWKKVTVIVRNRHGGRAGEYRLVEYMLEGLRPGPVAPE